MFHMLGSALVIAIAVIATFLPVADVRGQTARSGPMLLVVHRQSTLVGNAHLAENASKSRTVIRSGTAVVGVRREVFGKPSRRGWRIATIEKPSRTGWVPAGVVTPFETRGNEFAATAVSLRAKGKKNQPRELTLPELILTQKNPAIQQAWREVARAVSENETLPEDQRLPEPYFARAEIWAAAKNYSDSLQDYLTAIKYARKANRDLLTYSAYFDKLYEVTQKLKEIPVPAAGTHADYAFAAREHYSHGYSEFFSGDLREAMDRFDSAVQLAPDHPLYWYFRALTHRRLGDIQRAQHDVLMGAFFERRYPEWRRRSLNVSFTRVQGKTRKWLESYRRGSPTNRLLRAHRDDIDKEGGS